MSAAVISPLGLVSLLELLDDHEGKDPIVDVDHPSVEIWAKEPDGSVRRWILVAIGERTVTVMNPANSRDRVLRKHALVWIRPDAIAFRDAPQRGYRKQDRVTWTREQGELGRKRARAARGVQA